MQRAPRAAAAAALILFEVTTIGALHALGGVEWFQIPWRSLTAWLQQAPADEMLPATLRVVALGLAYWLTASTALYGLALLARIPAAVRAVEWATLPVIRRAIDGTAALTMVAATVAGPSAAAIAAADDAPIVIEINDEGLPGPPQPENDPPQPPTVQPEGIARIGWTPTPAGLPTVAPPSVAPTALDDLTVATTWEVAVGDNLWTIAARHLSTLAAPGADGGDVGAYWRQVIDANLHHLRSGDPDLIYPGESIVLPPPNGSTP